MSLLKHIRRYYSKDWGILYISRKNTPIKGDTITINNLTAKFK